MKRWLIPSKEKTERPAEEAERPAEEAEKLAERAERSAEEAEKPAEKVAKESGESPWPSTSGAGRGARHKGVHKQSDQPSSKCRKYREEYLQYGFTCVVVDEIQHPQCVVCTEVLAHESLKPVKMLTHEN